MTDRKNTQDIHRVEQVQAVHAELAAYHAGYYTALVREGLSELVALELAKTFITANVMVASPRPKDTP